MISISIVSFNTLEDLIVCVDSLLRNIKLPQYEVLINAFNYDPKNKEQLSQRYTQETNISITYTEGIRGYSANHNINLTKAKYDIVCILNDDTYIKEDIFSNFYRVLQDPDVVGCCPIFLNFDGSIQVLYRKKLSPWHYLATKIRLDRLASSFGPYADFKEYEKCKNLDVIEIEYGLGACFCIKRMFLEERILNEDFFLGPDDLYWSYLLRRNNSKKILLSCRDFIYHRGHTIISNHFASALPTQFKGMMDLFEKMDFRFLGIFRLIFFLVVLLGFMYNAIAYVCTKRDRYRHLRIGYLNTAKVFWRTCSNPALFRFFYRNPQPK